MVGYVGAGSNLGDREENLRAGLAGLPRQGLRVRNLSSLWETEPVDSPGSPWFLNVVARVETELSPIEAMRALLAVENEAGRRRSTRNAPRVLDLDLLLLGEQVVEAPGLTLPHPRMWGRRFVLGPLAELAPLARNPATGRTVAEELLALPESPIARRLRPVAPIALQRDEPL
jgi:2-amino-4-hydroxy-6-hydroxymethyldihydropteridine diphosphokinase